SKRDWSSDVCSSDLLHADQCQERAPRLHEGALLLARRCDGRALTVPVQRLQSSPPATEDTYPTWHFIRAKLRTIEPDTRLNRWKIGRASCREREYNS